MVLNTVQEKDILVANVVVELLKKQEIEFYIVIIANTKNNLNGNVIL